MQHMNKDRLHQANNTNIPPSYISHSHIRNNRPNNSFTTPCRRPYPLSQLVRLHKAAQATSQQRLLLNIKLPMIHKSGMDIHKDKIRTHQLQLLVQRTQRKLRLKISSTATGRYRVSPPRASHSQAMEQARLRTNDILVVVLLRYRNRL